MKNMEQCLQHLNNKPDRSILESYIERNWVRPVRRLSNWCFDEVDIARIELVHQLQHEIKIGDDAIDIVLSLLDQFHGLHSQMHSLTEAIKMQPLKVQTEISAFLGEERYPINFKRGVK
jgi:chaperone modulatory protein CbpM